MNTPITPPAAPDLVTLFNFSDAIAPALADALRDAGIFQPSPERSAADLNTPRVECSLQMGAVISKGKLPAGSTNIRDRLPTMYACTLVFTVATDRTKNATAHGPYEALVRILAAAFFHQLNSRLAFHFFEEMDEAGTTPSMINDEAKEEDISQLRFAGKLSIRPTAWPVRF